MKKVIIGFDDFEKSEIYFVYEMVFCKMGLSGTHVCNKLSEFMTSPGPAFQEYTGSW